MNQLTVLISAILVLVAKKTFMTTEMVEKFKVDQLYATANCQSYNADMFYHFAIRPEIRAISDQHNIVRDQFK